ncbi:MAG: zinc ABC transporter substrate-binding protein [Betaproteobacteria bacterium]|nr:zinc ABC transporter substrate-binding protein [Betaproteobacteria bacterium]
MKKMPKLFLVALLALWGPLAHATVRVFACEPEWGALVKEIAGDRATVYVATTAMQDVHRIQARPSLIARARSADLVVCTGAELEIGWIPMVRSQSGNERIQLGKPGYLEVASFVPRIEVPTVVDRALGDMHPQGNPHIQFGPRQMQLAAVEVEKRLAQVDPAGEQDYRTRLADFTRRWKDATARWATLGAPLKGVGVIQYHKNFSYLFDFLGMRETGTLEPKPGVEPTSSHLNELITQQKTDPARMVIRSSYHAEGPAQWLASRIGVPSIMLPATVGGTPGAKDLFGLYDDSIRRMLDALKQGG